MSAVEVRDRGSILLTSNFSNTTGFAWKFFRRMQNAIAREMHARGVGVRLSFARIDGEIRTVDPDIPIRSIQFDLENHSGSDRGRFLRFLREERVRHVYFTDFRSWSPLYPLMRMTGVKQLVVHNHISVPEPYLPPQERGIRGLTKWALHRLPALPADSVYACSEFVRQRLILKARCPAERISVIHHGIDLDRFICPPPTIEATPVNIVLIARAVREKGVQVLLEAAAELRRSGEEWFRISYGGDGPELATFRQMAADLAIADKVEFVGVVGETETLLRTADIVVVPSVWGDAAPLSVLEAMASGRALVVTDVGGIPEQIGDSGCALLVPPGNATALADAMRELIRDPARRLALGLRARRRAEQQFGEARFHQEVISRVLADCRLG